MGRGGGDDSEFNSIHISEFFLMQLKLEIYVRSTQGSLPHK